MGARVFVEIIFVNDQLANFKDKGFSPILDCPFEVFYSSGDFHSVENRSKIIGFLEDWVFWDLVRRSRGNYLVEVHMEV